MTEDDELKEHEAESRKRRHAIVCGGCEIDSRRFSSDLGRRREVVTRLSSGCHLACLITASNGDSSLIHSSYFPAVTAGSSRIRPAMAGSAEEGPTKASMWRERHTKELRSMPCICA